MNTLYTRIYEIWGGEISVRQKVRRKKHNDRKIAEFINNMSKTIRKIFGITNSKYTYDTAALREHTPLQKEDQFPI